MKCLTRDAALTASLLAQADRVLLGEFVLNNAGNTAEHFEDGMHQMMGMGTDDEALRVLLHDGDPDLEPTIFSGSSARAPGEQGPSLPPRDPEVVFSLKWLRILYGVL
eukprot:CAMPEP_0114254100 /NCGR_PEP_ID=MMETSP0058-20121206/16784_1 /TAXON_ID=36894 /ORGANISM="Pyramimonas parkeae, CCMP726" /LENGTH=107 /DNA_ID=CAMNT_0001368267 /DNA_START=958 /DNA_END=1278 /DNA_ORIENTATION=-